MHRSRSTPTAELQSTPAGQGGGTSLWLATIIFFFLSPLAGCGKLISVVGRVSRSVSSASLQAFNPQLRLRSWSEQRKEGFFFKFYFIHDHREQALTFSTPGLTLRRRRFFFLLFLLFCFCVCVFWAFFSSVTMLWKLADNVKYEDDCEVSGTEQRKQQQQKKFDAQSRLEEGFLILIYFFSPFLKNDIIGYW